MQHVVLHFLLHSSAPGQGVEGFPDIVSAACLFWHYAPAPIDPEVPVPASPVPAAVSVDRPSGPSRQTDCVALAPVLEKKQSRITNISKYIHLDRANNAEL